MNDLELDSSRLPAKQPLAKMGSVDKIYLMRGSPRLLSAFSSLLAFGLFSSFSFAQTSQLLIGWDLPGSSTLTSVNSVTNVADIVGPQAMALGPGLSASSNAGGWGSNSWTNGGTDPFLNNSLGKFFGFQVTAGSGKKVTISGASKLSIQVSPSGPKYWHLLVSRTNTTEAFANPWKNFGPFTVTNPPSSTSHTDITAVLSNAISADGIVIEPAETVYFRLIGWGGTLSTGSGRISSTNVFSAGHGLDFGLTGTVETVSVTKSITWNGGANGAWDRSTASWYETDPGSPVPFADGDSVTFPAAAAINVASNVVAGSIVATHASGETLSFSGSGSISSPSSLTISSGGAVELGVPTALGSIQLTSGQLVASVNNALSGNLTADGPVDLGTTSHSALGSASFGNALRGTGLLNASLGYSFYVADNFDDGEYGTNTVAVALAGSGGLVKTGLGTLVLAASHSYTGNISLNGGQIVTTGSEFLPDTANVSFAPDTTLKLGGNETLNKLIAASASSTARVDLQGNTLTLTATGGDEQFQGVVEGAGALVKQGTGIWSVNERSTFSGGTTLKSGSLRLQASGVRSTNADTGAVTLDSGPFGTGTLRVEGGKIYSSSSNSSRTIYNPIDLAGDLTLGDTTSNGDINISTNVTGAVTTLATNAKVTALANVDWYQPISGSGRTLSKDGAAALHLRGVNTLDSLQVLGGALYVRNSNSFATVLVGSNAVLGYGSTNVSPASYFGAATLVLSNGATFGQYTTNGPAGAYEDRQLPNPIRILGEVTLGLGTYSSYFTGGVDLGGTQRTLTLSNSTYFWGSVTNGNLELFSAAASRVLVLGGSNQFNGPLNLRGGILVLSNNSALQGATQILFSGNSTNGGTLGLTPANTNDYSTLFSSGDLQNYRIDTGGADSTLATPLGSTNGTFYKSGLGTLTLPVANTFSGGATLAGGRLALGHNQALGTGEFLVDQSDVEIEALVPLTLNQDVRLSGSPNLVGSQPITLSGVTRVSGGNRAFYPSNTGGLTLNRVELSTSSSNNAYRLVIYGTSPVVVNGPIVDGTNALYPDGIPGGHFRMSNASSVTFAGTNTFTGPVWLEAGALVLNHPQTVTRTNDLWLNGGTLRFQGAGVHQFGNLAGSIQTNTVTETNVDGSGATNILTNTIVTTNALGGTLDMGSAGAEVRVASCSNWVTGSTLIVTNYPRNNGKLYLPTNLTSEQLAGIQNAANLSATASVDSQGLLSFSGSGNTAPVIAAGQSFTVLENSSVGTGVGSVAASDAEGGALSGWTIVSGDPAGAFFISPTGQILVAGPLNFEATPVYTLGLQVSDGSDSSAVETVTVTVGNVAEFSDVFGAASLSGDANGDGVSNLMAYALGASSSSGSVAKPASAATSSNLSLTAVVRTNDPKCVVVGEAATGLNSWTNSPIAGVPAADQSGAVAGVSQKKVFSVDRGADPKKFLRLKATYAP
jgi:autotransporter-associated beta strand protein